jgi:hypothetical protein
MTEAYFGHFLGATGAAKFLNAYANSPEMIAATILPNAASSNPEIFYDGQRARTVSEIYSLVQGRLKKKAESYGISFSNTDSFSSQASLTPPTAFAGQPPIVANATKPVEAAAMPIQRPMPAPISDAYGFNTVREAPTVTQPVNNQMDKTIMLATESLLTQQLGVQMNTLTAINSILAIMSQKTEIKEQSAIKPTPDSPRNTYTPPKPSVPMNRVTA